jgi:hypothetical protein
MTPNTVSKNVPQTERVGFDEFLKPKRDTSDYVAVHSWTKALGGDAQTVDVTSCRKWVKLAKQLVARSPAQALCESSSLADYLGINVEYEPAVCGPPHGQRERQNPRVRLPISLLCQLEAYRGDDRALVA